MRWGFYSLPHWILGVGYEVPNPTPHRSSSINGHRLSIVQASLTLRSARTIGPLC